MSGLAARSSLRWIAGHRQKNQSREERSAPEWPAPYSYPLQLVTCLGASSDASFSFRTRQLETVSQFYHQTETGSLIMTWNHQDPEEKEELRLMLPREISSARTALFLCRLLAVPITSENISQVTTWIYLSTDLPMICVGFHSLLQHIYRPWLEAYPGVSYRLNSLIDTFQAARKSVSTAIRFQICMADFSSIIIPQVHSISISREVLISLENSMKKWIELVEMFLGENIQIYREYSTMYLQSELKIWKCRWMKLCQLLHHIKDESFQTTIKLLNVSNSKMLEIWQETENRSYQMWLESGICVNNLENIVQHCKSLYSFNPTNVIQSIPAIFDTVSTVYNLFPQNTMPEQITAIFSKITNQMIQACRIFLSNNGTETIWSQPKEILLQKIKSCITLNKKYQSHFEKVKILSHSPNIFLNISQNFIFAKFDIFCLRLEKIHDIMKTISTYQWQLKTKVGGILIGCSEEFRQMSLIFENSIQNMKEKNYDHFDPNEIQFNKDYSDFKENMDKIRKWMISSLISGFESTSNCYQGIRFLIKMEKINLDFEISKKYWKILERYNKELDYFSQKFHHYRKFPPSLHDFSFVAEKISWTKYLLKRIEDPIKLIKEKSDILNSKEGKKIIKKYNLLAQQLIHDETLYYQTWLKQSYRVKTYLHTQLLMFNSDSGRIEMTKNQLLWTFIRECNQISRLGFKIPDIGHILLSKQVEMKKNHYILQTVLKEYKEIQESVPNDIHPLMEPHWLRMNSLLNMGVKSLSWGSIRLSSFVRTLFTVIQDLKALVFRITSIIDTRIELLLFSVEKLKILDWPDKSLNSEDILIQAQISSKNITSIIHAYNTALEEAVIDLIEVCLSDLTRQIKNDETKQALFNNPLTSYVENFNALKFPSDDGFIKKMEKTASDLFQIYANRFIEGLINVIKNRLETLYCTITNNNIIGGYCPELFQIEVQVLGGQSNIELKPDLNFIQNIVNQLTNSILDIAKGVTEWKRKPLQWLAWQKEYNQVWLFDDQQKLVAKSTVPKMSSLFHHIDQNKDILELKVLISSCVGLLKDEIDKVLWMHSSYQSLCSLDKNKEIKAFLSEQPSISDFHAKMNYYKELEDKSLQIPNLIKVKCLSLLIENFKICLAQEARLWYFKYGIACRDKYNIQMKSIFRTLDDLTRSLGHLIFDADDVEAVLEALVKARNCQIDLELAVEPIEECYNLLNKFKIPVKKDEMEKVDTLRYSCKKLYNCVAETEQNLVTLQSQFVQKVEKNIMQFFMECDNYCQDYQENKPMIMELKPKEGLDRLRNYQDRFDSLWLKYSNITKSQRLLGTQSLKVPGLLQIRNELGLLQKLYLLYNDVVNSVNNYYEILWSELEVDKVIGQLSEFQNRCRKLPKILKEWPAFISLKKIIDDFNELCPLIELMTNKAMKDRHWDKLKKITGHDFDVENVHYTLKHLLEIPLLIHKEDIEDICISAQKEKDIEAKLQSLITEWENHNLTFANFKNRGELLLRGDHAAEIITLLEDNLTSLGSLLNNRYNDPFRLDIQQWISYLSTTHEVLERWLLVQNLWVYLEAVFIGGDIAKQLPKEANQFSVIDRSWVKIMNCAHECPNVVKCCAEYNLPRQLLPYLQGQLELCQKSLTGYLEKKRLQFPRFFFVSDPTLLEILGQASDSHSIQSHLLNIFDNTKWLTFDKKQYNLIVGIVSSEGEKMQLDTPILAEGNVEEWLNSLLLASQNSLHDIIKRAADSIFTGYMGIMEFLQINLAQVGLLGLQLIWTREAEVALSQAKKYRQIMTETNQAFLLLLNSLIKQTTKKLQGAERTKYENLIVIQVHQRDIFDELCSLRIESIHDFEWQRQCRFYFYDHLDQILISLTDVNFIYQNEFLGCTERLVVTPLTDRCYITLAQALNMCMGGCPTGPAGTGKTETTKDMGKTLGKYVVVFNCSDQMDYRGLGRIFKGLAQSGSWGCFDEFNRIELPVLSVAAQQIAIILKCKKEKQTTFLFSDGDTVPINPEFGIFLTMNPGYAGRQELPENLKVQFRTVAMMVPDRQIIIRVKLASCGFLENATLGRKFYCLYNLCEEQLTKQVHYDFGLRNILSVLRTLGLAKRQNPLDSESSIVIRVLKNMNLSKLIDEDEPLFLSLVDDLFPGIMTEKKSYPQLEFQIEEKVEADGLINHPPWILKLIQLHETMVVRHGIVMLGPAGAGKTTCLKILSKAANKSEGVHREIRLNPKAITTSQMFGRLDAATNDWTDGIFSALWRKTCKSKKGEHIWLVLDGPIDAVWIESLNSVLDDNRTLTLANGDRIPMSPTCKIVFEVDNIENASPATISRNGIVYMSSSGLTWKPIVQAWLKKQSKAESEYLGKLFQATFQSLYIWTSRHLFFKTSVLEFNIINQMLTLLGGWLKQENSSSFKEEVWNKLYTFACMWSLGALLEVDQRHMLEKHLRTNFSSILLLPPSYSQSDMFDYWVDLSGNWQHWEHQVESSQLFFSDDGSILIPNTDNVRMDFLLDTVCKQRKEVLLIGQPGTAKTVIIKTYLNKYQTKDHLHRSFNFSFASTPMYFQKTIESYIEKRMGNTFGPQTGKKMSVFIDDINMPLINQWGDQVTNEIVRQTIEMKGFYSLERPGEFINLIDMQFLAAMCQPGGGRNDIPSRLKRHFAIFNCTLPSDNWLDKIFGTIAKIHFSAEKGFSLEIQELIEDLVPLTRSIWQKTKACMLPTPANFHYVFNLRDISHIWKGMTNAQPSVITSKILLLWLWKHECLRTIADRFTCPEDENTFQQLILQLSDQKLKMDISFLKDDHYFAHFLRDAPEGTLEDEVQIEIPRIYELVTSFEMLEERLSMFLTMYNEIVRGIGMDLVFFKESIIHLLKISRILQIPGGNGLLVGVGGSGKQSLTKLSSFIANYQIFQIILSRSYSTCNFLDDMKNLYKLTGVQDKETTFIFSEQDLKEETFLEYLNNILTSGMISNLFNREEQLEIIQELSPLLKRGHSQNPDTSEAVFDYFLSRSRKNLHLILCFSPVGEKLRKRALKFPGIVSGCVINWFQPWPQTALIAVAHNYLDMLDTKKLCSSLATVMGSIHHSVTLDCQQYFQRYRRTIHVTPKSYLTFIISYKRIYKEKQKEIGESKERMQHGILKLEDASTTVEHLNEELATMEKELETASDRLEQVLNEVTVHAEEAEKVKNNVQEMKNKLQLIVNNITIDKAIAEEKLEEAKPALEEAEAALNTIKPSHIATIRKLSHPPHLIMRIMDCVLILFQRKLQPLSIDMENNCINTSWEESLKFMASTGFLLALQNFNKDSINDETIELLAPYFQKKDYNMNTARRVCGDVAGLLSWTKAMAFFYNVNKEVIPLKTNLQIQEDRLKAAMEELTEVETELEEKEKKLLDVRTQYETAIAEKERLTSQAQTCSKKMHNATVLINQLADEYKRWSEQNKQFEKQIERLAGDCLLATGFLSYAGPFNQEFRNKMRCEWEQQLKCTDISFTEELNVIQLLVDDSVLASWNLSGLPSDQLSLENGIITLKASRYPLLVDPQNQAGPWIRKLEKENGLRITRQDHKHFRSQLEESLSHGYPLLIEDVGEELDPILDNILDRNFAKSGTKLKVMVGDRECEVKSGFTLYLTSQLPNPVYMPEVAARTCIVDFTVTFPGLEDQLLGRVILAERAELEKEKMFLSEEIIRIRMKMKQLEDKVLNRLNSIEGSLIDDENLIGVLRDTKKTAQQVFENLTVVDQTRSKIDTAREEFRPVATRGSVLYFLLVEMSAISFMYQVSLGQFLRLFDMAIHRSERDAVTAKRVCNMVHYLTLQTYKYFVRGYYQCHKFTFVLLLALKIDLQRGYFSSQEFLTLVKGGAGIDLKGLPPKTYQWITDTAWLNLVGLSQLAKFQDILSRITQHSEDWQNWLHSCRPEEVTPDGLEDRMNVFDKLLLIRSLCPDRILPQARKYVIDSLGEEYIGEGILDLETIWRESDPTTPLVCLLSVGVDPTSQIETLAKKHQVEYQLLSMGQGQEIRARRLLSDSMLNGTWLLLQNCHLCIQFSYEILDIMKEVNNFNPKFRLWITTEMHIQFPINILQSSIKFTNEPPAGVKASLKRIYTSLPEDLIYNAFPGWTRVLYTVAFFHAVLQERRKYGPLGWNIPYEFNQTDFMASIQFLQKHIEDLDANQEICWKSVTFILGDVHYGGRITDDLDKRLLTTYTNEWFTPAIFNPDFHFYTNYSLPSSDRLEENLLFINNLPNVDDPGVFGLDNNADITYQINMAQEIFDTILRIQPKDTSNEEEESREAVVYKLAEDMLNKLPKDFIKHEVKDQLRKLGPSLPTVIFLGQEIDRMQRVLTVVRNSLLHLRLAIDGSIVMSDDLRQTLDCIYLSRIPPFWTKISWESNTLGFWLDELLKKDEQYRNWSSEGKPNTFWMTGFFNPQGFLTAVRQEMARSHSGWSLDNIVQKTTVTTLSKEEIKEAPREGAYVHGLFLEGASWDKELRRLAESTAKTLFQPFPVIWVSAATKISDANSMVYKCPVYRNVRRSSSGLVGWVDLTSDLKPSYWILRGVALLCDIK